MWETQSHKQLPWLWMVLIAPIFRCWLGEIHPSTIREVTQSPKKNLPASSMLCYQGTWRLLDDSYMVTLSGRPLCLEWYRIVFGIRAVLSATKIRTHLDWLHQHAPHKIFPSTNHEVVPLQSLAKMVSFSRLTRVYGTMWGPQDC